MSKIQTFPFNKDKFDQIRQYHFGNDWPVVYILEDGREMYIGETINIYNRSKQHYEKPERQKLKNIHIITDEEYNKSATLDIESWLIQYIAAEGSIQLQNANSGLKNHSYYERAKYKAKFELIWEKLKEKSIVHKDLLDIRNSNLFKYSPYKALTEDQDVFVKRLFSDLKIKKSNTYIVNGLPGTGKTVLATYLMKFLKEHDETKDLKIGLVVPMGSLRRTIRNVFAKIPGLKVNMVLSSSDVVKDVYDILIVDEAHRLKQRRNLGLSFGSFDNINKKLGLDKEKGTQLDWILKSSKQQILFYDKNQSVMPSDISHKEFDSLEAVTYDLKTQLRIQAGSEYLEFIEALFDLRDVKNSTFKNYDFKIYDDIREMKKDIESKNKEHGLSRMVAGYAWPWVSNPERNSPEKYDIKIDGLEMMWNSTREDWVNSPNALNEVGCIHTVQGYDLNYIGVIIGPELSYNPETNQMVVDKDKYYDRNGRASITDPEELLLYIKNIYKTLLTRGIKGTYLYIVDEDLRKYIKNRIKPVSLEKEQTEKEIKSPYKVTDFETVDLPMFESVGCGELLFADSTVQEMISVRKDYMSGGSKYFILRTSGDSMNNEGINDGDLVLCRKDYHPDEGNNVVALVGEDATIKKYHRENGYVVLKPCSTNKTHESLKFKSNEEIKILGVVVRVLNEDDIR